jgi:hypothetical protein
MKKLVVSFLLLGLCTAVSAQEPPAGIRVLADSGAQSFEARKQVILRRWSELRPVFSDSNLYDQTPSYRKAPYQAGKVKDGALKDGINILNFFRFLVGLPDDVELRADYNDLAQHGSALNAAKGQIAHQQAQPPDMPADFYQKAATGIGSSNLHQGQGSVSDAVKGWMDDSDSSNIDRLGHRRWALNPGMRYTGLSYVDGFSALYSLDQSRTVAVDYQAVAFPSGAAYPSDFFAADWAWNVSVNPDLYQTPARNRVTLTLTEVSGGKTWNFGNGAKDGYFNIETSGFGIPNCIIFRPQGISKYTGAYRVEVKGLLTKAGTPVSLRYETTFFDMEVEAGPGDFQFTVKGQELTITKYLGSMKQVIIPAKINGVPVTTIGKGAFTYADISGLTLPKSLTLIEDQAFWYSGITSITIPPGVTSIGSQAFYACNKLITVTLPDSPVKIGNFAFSNCTNLTTVTIPAKVSEAGYGAFANCDKLSSADRTEITRRFGNTALGR